MGDISPGKGVSLSDSSELSSATADDMSASMEKSLARLDITGRKGRRASSWKPLDLGPAAASIEKGTGAGTTIDGG